MVCYYLLVCFHLSPAHVISLLWFSFIQHLQPIALQWLPKDDLTTGHKPADSLWSCHHSVTVIYDLPVSDVRPWEALWICCSDVIFVPVNYITYRLAHPPHSVVSPWILRLGCTGRYIYIDPHSLWCFHPPQAPKKEGPRWFTPAHSPRFKV